MEISEIKANLTLAMVLHHYHLKPDKNLRLCCPFHEDKTPSMQVYYKTHTAFCFSSNCKTHGKSIDVIDFVMHKENCSKHEAILKAKEIIGRQSTDHSKTEIQTTVDSGQLTISKHEVLNNMFTYFKNAVHNSKPAQDYIKSRSLEATRLEIGYNTAQFHHGARRDETLINNCVAVGLLSPSGVSKTGEQAYKPFAKHCICFALRDQADNITGLYFRSTVNNDSSKHYYLKDSIGLYPSYPKSETEVLIISESIIDTASLMQHHSILNPEINSGQNLSFLSAYGTNRLNDEMKIAILLLPNLQEIIFAFDNDDAGNKAVEKYSKELQQQLPKVKFSKIELPCKDVNETLQAHNEEIFTHLLSERKGIDFIFSNEIKTIEEPPKLSINTDVVEQSKKTIDSGQLTVITQNKLYYQSRIAHYYILGGLPKTYDSMKVMLLIIPKGREESERFKSRETTNIYEDKQIEKRARECATSLELNYLVLLSDLYKLADLVEKHIDAEEKQLIREENKPIKNTLTQQEKSEAMKFAKDKNLIKTIREKLTQTGIVGEDENKIFLFVVAASHLQENPLNALIQGSSGSGKTNLLKGIYKTMPSESKKIFSRLSEKMLFNVPKYYFKNKLVCFEDVDGLGEEAQYGWRELVSNGELISGVSYKDEKGNIGVKELVVYGPITSIACTTKGNLYADNMSRLFLIAIDESTAQTQRINEYQAKEASGQIDKAVQKKSITQLQNYVRLLHPYEVYNPHATKLKLPTNIRDERRLYKLYLHFIEMITVLHQHQRKKTNTSTNLLSKLVATKKDCQIAKDLLFECIMLKMDELDGSLRQFFERLKTFIQSTKNDNYEFTQREIRETLQVKKTQLSYYITELLSLEYLQQTSAHINKGNRYKVLHFDNYRKMRADVKDFLQTQIDSLEDE